MAHGGKRPLPPVSMHDEGNGETCAMDQGAEWWDLCSIAHPTETQAIRAYQAMVAPRSARPSL